MCALVVCSLLIQTVNAEIDAVVETNTILQKEIDNVREFDKEQDNYRETQLTDMYERLQSTMEAAQYAGEQSKDYKDNVSQISKKVSGLFYKLQCDQMDNKVPPTAAASQPNKTLKG